MDTQIKKFDLQSFANNINSTNTPLISKRGTGISYLRDEKMSDTEKNINKINANNYNIMNENSLEFMLYFHCSFLVLFFIFIYIILFSNTFK